MKDSQVRSLIEQDLDVILPNERITCGQKILMYIENEDGLEKIINGWNVVVYINDREIEFCTRCKNGKTGWVEFIDKDLNLQKEEGDVKVFLCVPFERNSKPPKIDIIISDMKINKQNMIG